jgi:serine protease Do
MDTQTPNQQQRIVLCAAVALSALVGLFGGVVGGVMVDNLAIRVPFLEDGALTRTNADLDQKIVELIEEESATINVVERVTPAVASVIVRKPAKASPLGFGSRGNFVFLEPSRLPDPDTLVEVAGGTGFFVTEDGLLVTNKHVVEDALATYSVVTNDGEEYVVTVVDTDPFFDIAVLRVSERGSKEFPAVTLGDSDRIRIGQTVIAIGNSLSQYRNTVTKGVVSGIDRKVSAYDFTSGAELIEGAIQTDAAINPGNSGGPLINLLGEVVGVNTAISAEAEGVGFAIPINEVKQAVRDVQDVGRIVRPWLGVRFVMLDEEYAAAAGLSDTQGALVVPGPRGEPAVVAGSPADHAGLLEGDVLLAIDGQALTVEDTLSKKVRSHRPGDVVTISVKRGEEMVEVAVTLAEFDVEE